MSRMTNRKHDRMFEVQPDLTGNRDIPREQVKPATPTRYAMCRVCRGPIPVGVGQKASVHKKCRKDRHKSLRERQSVIIPSKKLDRREGGAHARVADQGLKEEV